MLLNGTCVTQSHTRLVPELHVHFDVCWEAVKSLNFKALSLKWLIGPYLLGHRGMSEVLTVPHTPLFSNTRECKYEFPMLICDSGGQSLVLLNLFHIYRLLWPVSR